MAAELALHGEMWRNDAGSVLRHSKAIHAGTSKVDQYTQLFEDDIEQAQAANEFKILPFFSHLPAC
jgi:hypothetical protein